MAARRLFEAADALPTSATARTALNAAPPLTVAPGVERDAVPPAISFQHVTLRYAPGQPPALDRVDLDIPAGEIITVVGPSGAGKSSLANALLRLWEIESGALALGESDVTSMTPEATRAQVGVVSQTTHLFNATIRTNLLLARPDATEEQIRAAVRAAQLDAFINGLPQGLDTPLGEGGAKLSGGERQRLAIARALMKDAPVLILDEPASSLDAGTEQALWETLRPLIAGRTVMLITHRLGAAIAGGRIAVMDRGRVVEMGDHGALLAAGGLYRRLWEQQNERIL
jgi:ATP-binding cassette subfamily C protein CydC